MPTNIPTSALISQVLQHTPVWVWGLLIAITALGVTQLADRVVTRLRLGITPLALGAFSLWGSVNRFGLHADVVIAWAVGVALAVGVNQWLRWPSQARELGAGRYLVPGSVWPLVGMWGVFGVRYVTTAALTVHGEWAQVAWVGLVMPMAFGALSGMFLARALRILHASPTAGTLSLA